MSRKERVDGFAYEGDVIYLGKDAEVYMEVPGPLFYENSYDWSDMSRHEVFFKDNWCRKYHGKYIVYKTTFDGGGYGHGPHDVYPDGHHVFAKMLNHPEVEVDFYQSGCFTMMMPKVKVVGKAKMDWTYEDPEAEKD